MYIGPESMLENNFFVINDLNWLDTSDLTEKEVEVKTRYRQQPVAAIIKKRSDSCAEITLREPIKAVTPGQACVIYDKDRLLGGGWISREIL